MNRRRRLATVVGSATLAALALNLQTPTADASDHTDGAVANDAAADIGDLYAWNDGNGNTVLVLTYAGLLMPGDAPVYDPEVLYTFHIDNTADMANAGDWEDNKNDNESDIQIHARFGMNGNGEMGLQVTGLPGAEGDLVGPVATDLGEAGANATAAMFDDPFFFDFFGFTDTVANLQDDADAADLAFASLDPKGDGPVDGIAGTNTMAIIVEFNSDLGADKNADGFMQLWATTGRVVR